MAKKYYGVAGENGYGVFNDYDKVLEIRGSIRKYSIQGFKRWDEAKRYARDVFYALQDGLEEAVYIPEIKRTNRFYKKRKARKTKLSHRSDGLIGIKSDLQNRSGR